MTNQQAKVQIGSISEATLRNEDLLEAFADELERLEPGHSLIEEARNMDPDSDEAPDVVDELMDALSNHAPAFCYFGAHPGDGADFGFWPDHDAIQEAQTFARLFGDYADGEFRTFEKIPAFTRLEYAFAEDDNVWIHVSDHGNVMILTDDNGKPGHEIWSCV